MGFIAIGVVAIGVLVGQLFARDGNRVNDALLAASSST